MFEILLLIILLRKRFRNQKREDEEENYEILQYNPGFISNEEIEDAVQEMQKNDFFAALLIYTKIMSLLKDKIVIQFQMYGLGPIWKKRIRDSNSNGTFQLAVAFKLVSKFREKFPEIKMTSQEPVHTKDEIEYLQKKNVHVFDRLTFSPEFFINSLVTCNVSNAVMICYMIHFCFDDFENFLHAHWHPEILSRIIFVGNSFDGGWCAPEIVECKKIAAYFKAVNRTDLPFEKPEFDEDDDPHSLWDWCPFHGHPSEFLAWKSFGNTDVYFVSYEDAEKMVKEVP